MTLEEVAYRVRDLQQFHGAAANGLFILEEEGKRLQLALNSGVIEISDPGNMNYQNVTLGNTDPLAYLQDRFAKPGETLQPDSRTVRWMESICAILAVVVLCGTGFFLAQFLSRDSQFMPKPVTLEIKDPVEAQEITHRYAGVYVTRVADGEMMIEIRPDGTWGYYDMYRGRPGFFDLDPVSAGTFKPVIDGEKVAIQTDTRFLFYPEESDRLIFLERPFRRIGLSRDELPYFGFPDMRTLLARF